MKKALLALICVALPLMEAKAAVTITQDLEDDFDSLVYAPRALAQTFTSTVTGSLTGIELLLGTFGNQNAQLTVQITSTLGLNVPDTSNVLWSASYNPLGGTAGSWMSISTLVGAPTLTSGQQYAIVLTSTDPDSSTPNNSFLAQQTGNVYGGGALLENRGSGWVSITSGPSFIPQPDADLAFRATIIPEPTSACMLLGSIGMLLLLRRR